MTDEKLAEMLAVIEAMKANDVLMRKFDTGEKVTVDEYSLALTANHALLQNTDAMVATTALLFLTTLKIQLDADGYTCLFDESTGTYRVEKAQ